MSSFAPLKILANIPYVEINTLQTLKHVQVFLIPISFVRNTDFQNLINQQISSHKIVYVVKFENN